MICKNCGESIPDNSAFCLKCGSKQNPDNAILKPEIDDGVVNKDILIEVGTKNHEPSHLSNKYNIKQDQSVQRKPIKFFKGLKITGLSMLGLFILFIIIGIIATAGKATLTIESVPASIQNETIKLSGTTNPGNTLTINGKDFSSSLDSSGKFNIDLDLQVGDNKFIVTSAKSGKKDSETEQSVVINRLLKDFTLKFSQASGTEIDKQEIELAGEVGEPDVTIAISDGNDNYTAKTDIAGKFNVKIPLKEIKLYQFVITLAKQGFNPYEQKYEVKRILPLASLKLDNVIGGDIYENSVIIAGVSEPKSNITITGTNLQKEISTTTSKEGKFSAKIDTTIEGTYNLTINTQKDGFTANSVTVEFNRTLSDEERLAQYKDNCVKIGYKVLKKNPDKYIGSKVKFTGKVLEIQEDGNNTIMRIAVTNLGYGIWDFNDVLFVTFNNSTDIVEDDIINVYGEVLGSYSYTSVAGWELTIPSMLAKYVEW